MDDLLKRVADAGLALGAAEEALDEGQPSAARDALDEADEILAELRGRWPQMSAAERTMVGRTAGPLRRRLEAARRRVPPLRAVSDTAPVLDPEQDTDPDEPPSAA